MFEAHLKASQIERKRGWKGTIFGGLLAEVKDSSGRVLNAFNTRFNAFKTRSNRVLNAFFTRWKRIRNAFKSRFKRV